MTLVVDHLEELFTAGRDDAASADHVPRRDRSGAPPTRRPDHRRGRVPGDYYGRFAAFPTFARLLAESQLLVGPMTDAEVHAAIEEPAHRAALTLEAGLADAIAADVAGQPGALPLLSTALLETWVRRRGRDAHPRRLPRRGRRRGAVARLAEDTYLQFTPDEQRVCRLLLLRLAEPGEGISDDVRRRVPLVELASGESARRACSRRWSRGVSSPRATAPPRSRTRRCCESGPACAAGWRRTATVAGSTTGSRPRRSTGTPPGATPTELYRGTRLDAALDWSAAHPGDANPLEREFLDAADAAHDHELRTARRTARRLRSLTVGLAVLLVVALVAGTVALVQRGDANRQATRANDAATVARATQLATLARTLPANRRTTSRCSSASRRRRLQPSLTTDGGLEAAITHRPARARARRCTSTHPLRTRPCPTTTGSSPPRATTATSGSTTSRPAGCSARCAETASPPFVALFNPDASLVVTGGIHGKVTIWRVATGKPIGPPIMPGGKIVYGVFTGGDAALHGERHGSLRPVGLPRPEASDPGRRALHVPGRHERRAGGGVRRRPIGTSWPPAGPRTQHTTIFDVATHRQ